MLKNVQPPYSLKMATLIYTIYINLTWGRIKPEEVPIKTTRTFSKAWNAGNCPSNNQRQHDTLSEEGNVLEITDRYTYNKQFFVQLTDSEYRPFFFFLFSHAEISLCPTAGFIRKIFTLTWCCLYFHQSKTDLSECWQC